MRPVINSGWTVITLLLAGTYLLGFAGSAMAEDWPPNGGVLTYKDLHKCMLQGTEENPASCTHYEPNTCADKNNDPNLSNACPGYRWIKRVDMRKYGLCQASASGSCDEYEKFYCAKLRMWEYSTDCRDNFNLDICEIWVYIAGCNPPARVQQNKSR
jgi:hypothetical protein